MAAKCRREAWLHWRLSYRPLLAASRLVASQTQGQILPVLLMAKRGAAEFLPSHFPHQMTPQVASFPGTLFRDSLRAHRPNRSSEAATSCLSLLSPEKHHLSDWLCSMQQSPKNLKRHQTELANWYLRNLSFPRNWMSHSQGRRQKAKFVQQCREEP